MIQRGVSMKVTDMMQGEHRLILRVLECLTAATEHAEAGQTLDVKSIRAMIEFFRGFADRRHHANEETHFFPIVRRCGMGCAPGNVDILLREHEEGRSCVRAMDESLSAIERGDSDARALFYENARRYVLLLTDHIGKEDSRLFPTADMMFSASDQQALLRAFAETDEKEMEPGAQERFHALADDLCAKWGVPIPAAEKPPAHYGHS